jgi:glycerol-3-phosphate O-acyltransferase 3/4
MIIFYLFKCLIMTLPVFALMQDSFTRCFKSNSPEPWNWNIYLFPLWCLGVVIRYGLLFPLRYLSLMV